MNESVTESMEDKVSLNGSLVLLPENDDDGIVSPPKSNNVDGLIGVESSGGSLLPTRKGFGLKKWRRIKREDGPVKEEDATHIDDGSKMLKRGLTGYVDPPFKHVELSSVEARQQSSEGSVASVNMMMVNHSGVANGFSSDPGFMFTVGQGFEKSEEEHSGDYLGAKNVVKIVSGKGSEDRVKFKKERPSSSMDSDLRSSDFVFSSGAVSDANHHVEKDEIVQTHRGHENGEKEESGDESNKNKHCCADKEDPLSDSFRSFAALKEALWKEVQCFQEMGKESIPIHSKNDEISDNCGGNNSISSGSQVLILMQKVKHLDQKLEEARAVVKAKETRIQELENSKIESELEDVFQRKFETEITHLVLTRSLSLQELTQPKKKLHSPTEDQEQNRGNMLGKTCKFGLYFLTQLVLLVSILLFIVLKLSPASQVVIPT
ncbi:unnamed protein product [Cochlearia groenlandica]